MSATTPSLKKNVVANYLGYAWRTAINLAFVPVYIRMLGVEAYGLIGIFATLQVMFSLLDVGLRPALTREMARFTAGRVGAGELRDLLRSIEWVTAGTALLTALLIWSLSGWLSREWVQPDQLDPATVAQAFALMGVVTAVRLIESIYTACLAGMQRQVLENTLSSTIAGVRAVGAVGVLMFVSDSILAFFVWQSVVSILAALVLGVATYIRMPASDGPARFSWPALQSVWRFAAGSLTIMVLSILLTQADKVLLSRLLPLETFGYYALAGVVAGAMTSVATPLTTAYYPRMTHLIASGEEDALRTVYHQASQYMAVVAGSIAMTLIVFARPLLLVWTGDSNLAANVAPIMAFLVFGTLMNSLMMIPYYLQLADGWVSLAIKINFVAVMIVVPAILLVVPRFGAVGAASIWAALNAGYLIVGIGLMHRRLLPTEKWRWYLSDTAAPLSAAAAAAVCLRLVVPDPPGRLLTLLAVMTCGGIVLTASALSTSATRHLLHVGLALAGRLAGRRSGSPG